MKPQFLTWRPGAGLRRRRLVDQSGKDAGKAALPLSRKRPRAEEEEIESDSVSGLEAAVSTDSGSDEGEVLGGCLLLSFDAAAGHWLLAVMHRNQLLGQRSQP